MVLYHGFSAANMRRILTAKRLVRGDRSKGGYYGVFAANTEQKALRYSEPWKGISMYMKIHVFKSKSLKQGVYVMKEHWLQTKDLVCIYNYNQAGQTCADDKSRCHQFQSGVRPIPMNAHFASWKKLDESFWPTYACAE